MSSYVISTIRTAPGGGVIYEVVTDRLQRAYVNVPRKFTDAATAHDVITHTLEALAARPKPVR